MARHGKVKIIQHFDERGLAFAALGYGRSTGKAGVFVCTSGTAVANAFPAVIEAATEGVPLLLFTADRPDELRGTGANQTIEQRNIFGDYPEMFRHMPAPEDVSVHTNSKGDPPGSTNDFAGHLTFLVKTLHECFGASRYGPVHLNWMFREPFTIEQENELPTPEMIDSSLLKDEGDKSTGKESIRIETVGETLIALGSCTPDEATEALKLSKKLHCPLLADVTSGLRVGSFELPADFSLPKPDTILHVGGRITSKSWHQWTETLRDRDVLFVHLTPTGRVVNPNRLDQMTHQTTLDNLVDIVDGEPTSDQFLQAWHDAGRGRDRVVEKNLVDTERLSEPAIAHFLCRNCPETDNFFIGNSMPIRDLDWYGTWKSDDPRPVFANRGASGIDGLLATATGVAIGSGSPTTVMLGDLSALHDLNSLALIAKSPWPLIVVIINNQSGHIFDLLPVRESSHFEQFFATPHAFHFKDAAAMFGIPYQRVTSMSGLRGAYNAAVDERKSVVMEIVTDRTYNTEVRQLIRKEILRCSKQG